MKNNALPYVIISICCLIAAGLVMSCSRQPTPTVPVAPTPTTTPWRVPPTPEPPPPMPALTPAAGTVDPSALLHYIPDGAHVLGAVRAELDGDAQPEVVVLLGLGGTPDTLSYEHLEMMVLELDRAPEQAVAWKSGKLVSERGEALQARDINGDGRDEVLSYQSMGAAGYTLYVLGSSDGAFGLLLPKGGYFDGQDHFGDVGVRLEDVDGDGLPEILASYGPAATNTDVFKWDGQDYAFGITLQDK